MIIEAIPNLRSVSFSGRSDFGRTAEIVGKDYADSRRPVPAPISGSTPSWDKLKKDIKDTYAAARDCNLGILDRDVYRVNGDRKRLGQWVDMTKSIFQL